jgi:hypothetical protein
MEGKQEVPHDAYETIGSLETRLLKEALDTDFMFLEFDRDNPDEYNRVYNILAEQYRRNNALIPLGDNNDNILECKTRDVKRSVLFSYVSLGLDIDLIPFNDFIKDYFPDSEEMAVGDRMMFKEEIKKLAQRELVYTIEQGGRPAGIIKYGIAHLLQSYKQHESERRGIDEKADTPAHPLPAVEQISVPLPVLHVKSSQGYIPQAIDERIKQAEKQRHTQQTPKTAPLPQHTKGSDTLFIERLDEAARAAAKAAAQARTHATAQQAKQMPVQQPSGQFSQLEQTAKDFSYIGMIETVQLPESTRIVPQISHSMPEHSENIWSCFNRALRFFYESESTEGRYVMVDFKRFCRYQYNLGQHMDTNAEVSWNYFIDLLNYFMQATPREPKRIKSNFFKKHSFISTREAEIELQDMFVEGGITDADVLENFKRHCKDEYNIGDLDKINSVINIDDLRFFARLGIASWNARGK